MIVWILFTLLNPIIKTQVNINVLTRVKIDFMSHYHLTHPIIIKVEPVSHAFILV